MSNHTHRTRMADWVKEYLELGIQSTSTLTKQGRRSVLDPFAEWYDQTRRHPRNVTHDDLVRFFMREAPFAGKIEPSTFNSYRTRMRKFLTWAMKTERLKTQMSLLEALDKQPTKRRNFVRMTDVQMVEIVDNCSNLRNRAMLACCFNHGPRESEIHALRLGDIHLNEGYILWRIMKGGAGEVKEILEKRITPHLDRVLRTWVTAYTGGGVRLADTGGLPQSEWRAFPRRSTGAGELYYPTLPMGGATKIVQRYTRPVVGRVKYDGGTHMARRSMARAVETNLVGSGMDPASARSVAQHTLGHQDPKTTDLYTGNSLPQQLAHSALEHDFLPDLNTVTKLRSVDDGEAASM